MPVTVEEAFRDSGRLSKGQNASGQRAYIIRGAVDEDEAITELYAAAPATFSGLYRQNCEVEPLDATTWLGLVSYGIFQFSLAPPEPGDSAFSFEIGGGTFHITQSKATVASYAPPGKTAPDHQGAIGVTESGVEGVDVHISSYQFTETHYFDDEDVTTAYKGLLAAMVGRVNNSAFKGLNPGECLFVGVSGSRRGEGPWELNFRFAGSPNREGLTIGDITGIDKEGWEYLWVQYETAEDATAKSLVQKPRAVFIERIYDYGDFSSLDIGT